VSQVLPIPASGVAAHERRRNLRVSGSRPIPASPKSTSRSIHPSSINGCASSRTLARQVRFWGCRATGRGSLRRVRPPRPCAARAWRNVVRFLQGRAVGCFVSVFWGGGESATYAALP
jgi:hypothetical protein